MAAASPRPVTLICALATVFLVLATGSAAAQPAEVSLVVGGQRLTQGVRSFKEIRDSGLTRQQLDFSCGAAALSTVLRYFFADPVGEDEIIGFIFIHGQTPQEGLARYLRRKGFSLLDLKNFAEFRGYKAVGYKDMDLKDLLEFLDVDRVPVIVPIRPLGYNHFVVLKGFAHGRAFLADPAAGNITMAVGRFLDLWVDGVGFIVTKPQEAEAAAKMAASDRELAGITAAGAAGETKTQAPPDTGTSLLTLSPEYAVPHPSRLELSLERDHPIESPRISETFFSTTGEGLFTVFEVQDFHPVVQLGDPSGNFVDFSPPPGQSIHVSQ